MNKRTSMNRLLLTSVSVIGIGFASTALADGNKTYLTQTGTSQNATITQNGGSNNKVGTSGAFFIQENNSGSGSNVLVVNQNTTSGGSNNSVSGWQSGTLNNANLSQQGSNSNIALTQLGASNGPTHPTPSVSAGWTALGWSNGTQGNFILQDSTTNGSSVTLNQSSATNAVGPEGNTFSIGQGGAGNTITAGQTGTNRLWIRQGTQLPDLWSWTYGNPFDPAETPNSLAALSGSTIAVTQTTTGRRNYAAFGQGNGSGNHIVATQTGGANNADANQIGSLNIFNSTQTNTGGTLDNFVGGEAGWPNTAALPFASEGIGDYRPITQIGTGNEYYSVQTGESLFAFGTQTGDYNFLSNTQSGTANTLWSRQTGNSNTIYSAQAGLANTTTVSQNLNSNYSSTSQTGTTNVATVTQ